MPVDRPTFSESWYRVCDLKPRLISTVQIHRQHFRGQTWHVVADPASNQFFRLNEAAYRFVALLDGRRTVAEAWKACNEQSGDDAPTQPEAIQLLGQLYTSNLLAAELPPDAEGLFARYRKRVGREIQGYLTNIMFVRIPLIDPDRFLDRWIGLVAWVFSPVGFVLWLAMMAVGGYFLLGNFDALSRQTSSMIMQMEVLQHLPLLYLSTAIIKVLHEFGHAFACKKFGRQTGTGGEVHAMGVMFLIFTPLPYVDASSSWAFRGKWQRMVVGMAGMYVELAVAAVAAVVWANTGAGTTANTMAFYMIFVAGFSTIVFNANPLLRYDGYYILSDALEMPNLWQRSRQYVYYLVKRYAWAVRRPHNPANTAGERVWLTGYGVASTLYRFVVCFAILMFIADRLFVLGAVLAVVALIAWVFVPLGKFVHYLLTSPELMRVRGRAVGSMVALLAAAVVGLGMVNAPDRVHVHGLVWTQPGAMTIIYAGEDGFLSRDDADYADFCGSVAAGQQLLAMSNPLLVGQRAAAAAELNEKQVDYLHAMAEEGDTEMLLRRRQRDPGAKDSATYRKEIDALEQSIARLDGQLAALRPTAGFCARWFAPGLEQKRGSYIRRGQQLGMLADCSQIIIKAYIRQDDAWLIHDAEQTIEFRIAGRPDLNGGSPLTGRIVKVLPAGQHEVPPALAQPAGGPIPVVPDGEKFKTSERVFEIHIAPDANETINLLIGQSVVIRFSASSKPLAWQWLRAGQQLVQRRFKM